MMDGRVAILKVLDDGLYTGVYHVLPQNMPVLSGPFRDALDCP